MRHASLLRSALLCAGALVLAPLAVAQTASVPAPGDLVVNEIQFGPPTGGSEYVEIYNRSAKTFDVAELRFTDNGGGGRVITTASTLVGPGQYFVYTQTLAAFQTAYPGVAAVQPPSWAVLNNSGTDAAVLKYAAPGGGFVVIDSVSYTVPPAVVGRSYERIDPAGASAASNFAPSTAAALGTPGAQNSVYFVDTAAPTVASSAYDPDANTLEITFSESVQTSTLGAANVSFSGTTTYTLEATGVSGGTATGVRLRFSAPLAPGSYTATVQNVRDAAGNTLVSAAVPFTVVQPGAVPVPGDVVVNEIMFAPPTGGSEFVELYNRSAKTFDLRDLRFIDNTGGARTITTASVSLAPGGYAVLAQNLATFQAAYPGVAAIQPPSWPTLNNDADAAVIKYAAAGGVFVVIDSVAYTAPPAPTGVSYERRDPTGPSVAANFAPSTAAALGTPGAQNSVYFIDIAAPLALNAEETTAQTVVVTFNEPLDAASVTPARFSVGGTAPTSATRSADGLRVTLVFASPLGADQLVLAAGLRDLKGNASLAATLVIGRAAAAGDLVVNEILAAPLAVTTDNRPDQPEYIELYNRSGKALSLTGLLIVGDPDETGKADTLRLATDGRTVPAGGYVVIYDADAVDGPNPATDSRLAKAFPSLNLAAPGIVLVPATTVTPGGLNNSGERLRLVRGGVTLDDVTYSSAWHNPSLRTSTGIALERRDPAAPSNEPSNWGSSPAPEGGTPGYRNALTLAPDDPNLPPREGITVEPSPFSPDGDANEDVAFLRYRLNGNVVGGTVRVRIFNLNGRLVRTLSAAQIAGATGMLEWDGRDDDGRGLALGPYVILLDAVDERGGTTASYRKVVTLARQLN